MEPKRKQILLKQRAHFEQKLKDRLSFLSGKGIEPPKAERDTLARKFEASIRAVNRRLKTVADQEKRTEELAKIKADRAAAIKKDQEAGKAEKPKRAPEESKGKKAKEEKKAAPPKAPKDAKSRKPQESSEKSKAAVKKTAVKKATEKKTAKKTTKKSTTTAKADKAS